MRRPVALTKNIGERVVTFFALVLAGTRLPGSSVGRPGWLAGWPHRAFCLASVSLFWVEGFAGGRRGVGGRLARGGAARLESPPAAGALLESSLSIHRRVKLFVMPSYGGDSRAISRPALMSRPLSVRGVITADGAEGGVGAACRPRGAQPSSGHVSCGQGGAGFFILLACDDEARRQRRRCDRAAHQMLIRARIVAAAVLCITGRVSLAPFR